MQYSLNINKCCKLIGFFANAKKYLEWIEDKYKPPYNYAQKFS